MIGGRMEHVLPVIATRYDMVKTTFNIESRLSCHCRRMLFEMFENRNIARLTPKLCDPQAVTFGPFFLGFRAFRGCPSRRLGLPSIPLSLPSLRLDRPDLRQAVRGFGWAVRAFGWIVRGFG